MFRIRSLLGTVLVLFCLTATAASSLHLAESAGALDGASSPGNLIFPA
jgi:hypothetical protein